jgi:hypothetical protein
MGSAQDEILRCGSNSASVEADGARRRREVPLVAFTRPVESANRRAQGRVPLPRAAAYVSDHRLLIPGVGDLSASGAFLSTSHPDPVGTRATLTLHLDAERIQLAVEVVRVSFYGGADGSKAGMGVCFADVPRALRRRLRAAGGPAAGRAGAADG